MLRSTTRVLSTDVPGMWFGVSRLKVGLSDWLSTRVSAGGRPIRAAVRLRKGPRVNSRRRIATMTEHSNESNRSLKPMLIVGILLVYLLAILLVDGSPLAR